MYGNSVNFNVNGILLNIVYIAKPCELNLAAFRGWLTKNIFCNERTFIANTSFG